VISETLKTGPAVTASIPGGENHGTTASSGRRSANPINNPAQPGNTVNVPVGTPAPRSLNGLGAFLSCPPRP
jgi:hypothetical protein